MSTKTRKSGFLKNYGLLIAMLGSSLTDLIIQIVHTKF